MKLLDLSPQFVRHEQTIETWTRSLPDGSIEEVTGPREHHVYVDSLADAQGVYFLCPLCKQIDRQDKGVHMVLCWFADRGVPDDAYPLPGRWQVSGNGYDDLTLSPSAHLTGPGCGWHGWVKGGDAT